MMPPPRRRRTASSSLRLIPMVTLAILFAVSGAEAKTSLEWAESSAEKMRQRDFAGALQDLNLGIEAHWNSAMLYEKRGDLFLMKSDYRDAIRDYDTALELDPKLFKALMWRAAAKRQIGDLKSAMADYDKAARLSPASSSAIGWRGIMKGLCGDLPGAVADLNSAIALDPSNHAFIFSRASAQDSLGYYHKAIADYELGLKLNPSNAQALNYLAWDYAVVTGLDDISRARAVELATQACELTEWKDPVNLDTLAAAYAATGEFDAAIKWQRACITLSPDNRWLPEARARLALYQKHQPYLIPPSKL